MDTPMHSIQAGPCSQCAFVCTARHVRAVYLPCTWLCLLSCCGVSSVIVHALIWQGDNTFLFTNQNFRSGLTCNPALPRISSKTGQVSRTQESVGFDPTEHFTNQTQSDLDASQLKSDLTREVNFENQPAESDLTCVEPCGCLLCGLWMIMLWAHMHTDFHVVTLNVTIYLTQWFLGSVQLQSHSQTELANWIQ